MPTHCAPGTGHTAGLNRASTSALPLHPNAAWVVIAAGVCAALHVGKLPPAISALQAGLGVSLVQAGFLLSAVQLAGMGLGIAVGTAAESLGARRSMAAGLLLLAAASALGAMAQTVAWLLLLRALEGLGFLLVVLPAPGLLRRLVPEAELPRCLGLWSAYMPVATTLALLAGPGAIAIVGWRGWWAGLAALTLLMGWWLQRAVPPVPTITTSREPWHTRLRETLAARGPWLAAMCFALYAAQWLAVIGFLPLIYTRAGIGGAATALLSAGVAAVNIAGNVASGRLLQRGVAAATLLRFGFITMVLGCLLAYAEAPGIAPWLRYLGVLAFSGIGGLIPATLFAEGLRVAPTERGIASTVGWMQQWSALGQFSGPPLVAWLAGTGAGWAGTWWLSGACAVVALALIPALAASAKRGFP